VMTLSQTMRRPSTMAETPCEAGNLVESGY